MQIKKIEIKNFRLLKDVNLSLEKNSTVIVGRNNSGKTSLTELFRRLFGGKNPSFQLEDFSLASLKNFKTAFQAKSSGKDELVVRSLMPSIRLKLTIDYSSEESELGSLSDFIIDFDENTTSAIIEISYQLGNGNLDLLFDGLLDDDDFFKKLKLQIPKQFTTIVTAIDPTDQNNTSIIGWSSLVNLINVDFINAERGLNDDTQSEKDVLGRVISNIFKNSSLEGAPENMKIQAQELESVVSDIQKKVDSDFKVKVEELLPALKLFGYPGLIDPKISTETLFDVQKLLENNTKIKYFRDEGICLPETYNGLGSRNLIYILFQLYDFFRKYQSKSLLTRIHIIFVEEPEAHLHPQMQEVFIRQLDKIVENFSEKFINKQIWPVQFVVSTHSTHIANEANFDSIRYFLTTNKGELETRIKDLKDEFNTEDQRIDKEFIHKYLTLTRCDLFFADKAIMIEGLTERLLMPLMIEKTDEVNKTFPLGAQYLSIIEIGGAFAHHFYKFLDFLELRTLIITDLDAIKPENTDGKTKYVSCNVSKGTHTSNEGIKNWFKTSEKQVDLDDLRKMEVTLKVDGSRRIAYQVPEQNSKACGRSFEDAFMLANHELFEISDLDDIVQEEAAFEKSVKIKKSDFAIEYALDETNWNVPQYIKEGLIWLAEKQIEKNIKSELDQLKASDG